MALALKKLQHYKRPVNPVQKSAAKALQQALDTGEQQEQSALQKFLFTLSTQNSQDSSHHTFTIYRFLILRSFRQEGNLSKSSIITQHISKIVFIVRGAIYNEITSKMTEEKSGFHA